MSTPSKIPRKKVAIVGSGSAGIAALWALNRTHHDVYLYEADRKLGGHTNTVQWRNGKYTTMVDAGFMTLNPATSPNFVSFLRRIGIETVAAPMTFALTRDDGVFEWASKTLRSFFASKPYWSPRMWRLLFDIVRFNQFSLDLLMQDDPNIYHHGDGCNGVATRYDPDISIGEYLDLEGYSDYFRDDYLVPLAAALWHTRPDNAATDFPAVTLVRFLWNNNLLSVFGPRPQWLSIRDGSQSYIDAVMKGFPPNHLFLNTPVQHVRSHPDGKVLLQLRNGATAVYDHVILATHGDQALAMVGRDSMPDERAVLSNFVATENRAVLHSDPDFMPLSREAWSSWNFYAVSSSWQQQRRKNINRLCLTYHLNQLQSIPNRPFGDIFVTLNPSREINPIHVQGEWVYRHMLYTPAVVRAQAELEHVQNTRGISYAGAWTRYGFHEDGFSSGLRIAVDHLGAKLPFEFVDSTYSRGRKPQLGTEDWLVRVLVLLVQVFVITLLERIFGQAKINGRMAGMRPVTSSPMKLGKIKNDRVYPTRR